MTINLSGSTSDAAAALAGKEISARELTELLLARIDAVNPTVNAVVELRREAALADADAADRALARGVRGPLRGVPMTIKESFHVAGLPTTWGNPAWRGAISDWDATVVERLRAAGAVIIGTTNVAFMLADVAQSANDAYGATNNPWDSTRTPGGSSGGAAAALASGLTFLEFGSDLGGSVRIPASYCGVYGLKPTVGIIPPTGLQPPGPAAPPHELTHVAAVGPLARTAADLRVALTATAGPEDPAAQAWSWALPAPRHRRLADFRVGVVLDHPTAPVSAEIGAALSDLVNALTRAGVRVVEGWPPGVDPLAQFESFGFHLQLFLAAQQPGATFADAGGLLHHEHRRLAARAAWARYFDDMDMFICPTTFIAAPPHDNRPVEERTIEAADGDHPYQAQSFWISAASLAGLPAVAAPIGRTSTGLPISAQLIGPLFEDDTAITFAELLADAFGGFTPPPL